MCIWSLNPNSQQAWTCSWPHQEEETHRAGLPGWLETLIAKAWEMLRPFRDSGSFPKKRIPETIVLAFDGQVWKFCLNVNQLCPDWGRKFIYDK